MCDFLSEPLETEKEEQVDQGGKKVTSGCASQGEEGRRTQAQTRIQAWSFAAKGEPSPVAGRKICSSLQSGQACSPKGTSEVGLLSSRGF